MLLHFMWTYREQMLQQIAFWDFATVLVNIPHGYSPFIFKLPGKYLSNSPFNKYLVLLVFLSMINSRIKKRERKMGRERENEEKEEKRRFKIVRKSKPISVVPFLFI